MYSKYSIYSSQAFKTKVFFFLVQIIKFKFQRKNLIGLKNEKLHTHSIYNQKAISQTDLISAVLIIWRCHLFLFEKAEFPKRNKAVRMS